MGKLVRGITVNKNARVFAVDSKDVVQKAEDIHVCSPTVIAGFGRLLSIGLMMGADLKNDDDKLSLKITCDGPVKQMIVTASRDGKAKGYVYNPYATSELTSEGKLNVGAIVGRGNLQVIKDMGGNRKPYTGVSNLQTGEIAEDIAHYFAKSEQIRSIVGAGVLAKQEMEISQAGGFIIQLLPGATDEFIDALEERVKDIKPVTQLLSEGKTPQEMLEYLLDGVEEVKILEEQQVEYACDCNREKFFRGVLSLGEKEIKTAFNESDEIETACQFCHEKYKFKKDEIMDAVKKGKE
ncbi:MAG: Hsp33 family molecular chaperone HslO [Fusobacteriota bacterium]